jgi:hypothetical protein
LDISLLIRAMPKIADVHVVAARPREEAGPLALGDLLLEGVLEAPEDGDALGVIVPAPYIPDCGFRSSVGRGS